MTRHPLRLDLAWRASLLLIGVRRHTAWAGITDDHLRIRFGVFDVEIPLDDIHGVRPGDWSLFYGIGVRFAPRSTVGFVGSRHGIVDIRLRTARRFRVPLPVRRERVALALEEPEVFIRDLERALARRRP